jgi:hypothetical protein
MAKDEKLVVPELQPMIGPPQSYPEFDGWDAKQHASAERAVGLMDAAVAYRNSGGRDTRFLPVWRQLQARGGLTQDEASQIARYKMWREGKRTPSARVPEDTPEEVDKRNAERAAATPERRAEMVREMDARKDESYTRFYDSLIGHPSPAPKSPAEQPGTPRPQAELTPPPSLKTDAERTAWLEHANRVKVKV